MKTFKSIILFSALLLLAGCSGVKVNKTMLKMVVAASNKENKTPCYADSCVKRIGIPYAEDSNPSQVVDIYYADPSIRRDAVLIDIHGGFYVGGTRVNNRSFASVFLKEGFDVVLVEYRLNDGKTDVSDELRDCAAALDYLTVHAVELGLNKDRMFLTGDSAGGHLALYMAEGSEDRTLPIHPELFVCKGALLNCPAYDFASFAESDGFTESALAWFLGPNYTDKEWMTSMSPRTYLGSYSGPLFVSTCTRDFIRAQSVILKEDCEKAGRPLEWVDIESEERAVGHVHNVINQELPESQAVNARMVDFMNRACR